MVDVEYRYKNDEILIIIIEQLSRHERATEKNVAAETYSVLGAVQNIPSWSSRAKATYGFLDFLNGEERHL